MPLFTPPPLGDGVPLPQRYWAILTVALAVTLSVLDGAIANVALPTIAEELHTTPTNSIWVINAYQLSITVALLPMASLGEILGYQRVYRFGLLVFTICSGLCAISGSLPLLVAARTLQGFGAAGVLSINTAMIRTIYPRSALGRGIGINAMVVALAAAAGPSIAAAILSVGRWPWLFAVNLPIGTIAFVISLFALPVVPGARRAFDWISALLNAGAFGLLVLGVDELAHAGGLPIVVAEIVLALIFGIALVLRQLSRPNPLLPIDLLRQRVFSLAALTSSCSFISYTLAYVALPFFFQVVMGRSEVSTGLLMTPWPLGVMVVAPLAGRLADRYRVAVLSDIGLAIFAFGLGALALLPTHAASADIAWRMALAGIGFGLFNSPNNRAMLSAAPKARAGSAAGALSMARLLGQTLGAALAAIMFISPPARATHNALLLATAVCFFAILVSSVRLGRRSGSAG